MNKPRQHYALIVIGAGPAGMAAAQCAANLGINVALLDEQAQPGGQFYRNVDRSPLPDPELLGPDYCYGRKMITALHDDQIDYFAQAAVWDIGEQLEINVLIDGSNYCISADHIVIATGAQERPMPIPGWQLPGVMTAGAAQILMKSAAMIPDNDVILAGSGPLLLLLASQYLRIGVKIKALLDTTPGGNMARAMRYLPQALRASSYLFKGLGLMSQIKQARIPVYKKVTDLSAQGDEVLQTVQFLSRGQNHELSTSTLLLHIGVIPQIHLTHSLDCATHWDETQVCWKPGIDRWGKSSVSGVSIAGDGAAIVGARAAELQGRLVGLQAASSLGAIELKKRDRLARPLRKSLGYHLAIRPFLDTLYRPAQAFLTPGDETMVCRCEEVSAGEIRALARMGCQGPNQAKAFSRCGMGPCQGRQCGATVSALIAEFRKIDIAQVGYYRVRSPVKPVTLGQIAK